MKLSEKLPIHNLRRRHWGLIALLIFVTIVKISPSFGFIYTTRIYPLVGTCLSHMSGILPFAVGDLFIAFSILWVVIYPIYAICLKKEKKKLAFGRVAEYLLWVYAWFYIAWGLNYSQPNIYQRTGMKPAKVSKAKLRDFARRYADSLNTLSAECRIKGEEYRMMAKKYPKEFKEDVKDAVLKGYNKLDHHQGGINPPFNQSPRSKTMMFSRLSSMAGVTGSMGPFFCEFTLNADILPHDYPATFAHEFAHFLGIANEGEANFYSYLVCTTSEEKALRFSGYYHIFFHVLANVYDILGEKEGDAYLRRIRPEIIQLAKSDRKYWLGKRCTLIDDFQNIIFDLYLKGNHISEGRKSYSGVIGLILSWEEKTSSKQP